MLLFSHLVRKGLPKAIQSKLEDIVGLDQGAQVTSGNSNPIGKAQQISTNSNPIGRAITRLKDSQQSSNNNHLVGGVMLRLKGSHNPWIYRTPLGAPWPARPNPEMVMRPKRNQSSQPGA
ncbi:hypothetical protein SKAU_G00280810 [Synaphobranchus kaupii]|uniref:Uncharacterized protein n=1 Tax=Synaphobranchus kaupii TaxID=118154 RepID=A0A9Q1EX34_SYNKA|nr:hypothetical protein SKAU_G00280810 [Synaphobranchus kaupii]